MIAQEEQAWEQVAEQVKAEVRELWEAAQPTESAEQLEAMVLQWRGRLGAMMLQALQQQVVHRREQVTIPMCCGRRMDYHSRQPKTTLTLLGASTVQRRYYRCLQCGRSVYPADAWLGRGKSFSHHLEAAVAWQCSLLPYRDALESLHKLAGVEVSVLGAERIVARWGKEELEVAPDAEPVALDLVVQIDGAMAHLEEGWKEIKVATCFAWDRTCPEAEPQAVSYVADWETAEEFRQTLQKELLARGVSRARSVTVLADGGPWIWDTADLLLPQAVQILDWHHLSEHLWGAAKVVHGEGEAATTVLAERWKDQVWNGASPQVAAEMRRLMEQGCDTPDHTLRRCAEYLQTHEKRIRYAEFRAMGLPTGSGVVEGACKHVVGLRFKRQSTRWSRPGAQAVLHLRLDRLNNRWDQRCNLMRQAA